MHGHKARTSETCPVGVRLSYGLKLQPFVQRDPSPAPGGEAGTGRVPTRVHASIHNRCPEHTLIAIILYVRKDGQVVPGGGGGAGPL